MAAKRSFLPLVIRALLLILSFVTIHSAEAGRYGGSRRSHKPPPKTVYRAIASVDTAAMTITTEAKNVPSSATKTYRINSQTKVTINGHEGTLADLKPGLQISVGAGMDADLAEEISLHSPPPDPAGTRKGSRHKRG